MALKVLLGFVSLFGSVTANGLDLPLTCQQKFSDEVTYDDVRAKIELCHFNRMEDVLSLLSETQKTHYTLMHHSQSDQGATLESPRAIVFGKDAKLILAFNGDVSQRGFSDLELIQFREDSKKFEMREIEFAADGAGPAHFSAANPPQCLACHRNDPAPNWASYPLWPGAFGGEDDSDFRKEIDKSENLVEKNAYARFVQNKAQSLRYRYLALPEPKSLPNTDLGSAITALNFQRISRKISNALSTSELSRYRYALVATLACNHSDHFNQIDKFISPEIQSRYLHTYSEVYQDTVKTNREGFLSRVTLLKSYFPAAPFTSRVRELSESYTDTVDRGLPSDQMIAGLRWILENNGIATSDWSSRFFRTNYDFDGGYLWITDLLAPLSQALGIPSIGNSDPEIFCAQLERESLNQFSEIKTKF